ncbi:TPA: GNVR domain-containing protein, partial [Pseudomonas aeruginosa]
RDVDQRIQTLRETAKLRREDRIVQLREALKVADAVGLEKPPMISGQVSEQLSAIMNGSLMYMRGSKALRGEIEALESRVSDDPFIPALRTLQEQEKLYSSLRVNTDEVAVFRQDGSVETPDSPVKPKKLLLVMMGLLLGGAVGVVTVVFNSLYRNKR